MGEHVFLNNIIKFNDVFLIRELYIIKNILINTFTEYIKNINVYNDIVSVMFLKYSLLIRTEVFDLGMEINFIHHVTFIKYYDNECRNKKKSYYVCIVNMPELLRFINKFKMVISK